MTIEQADQVAYLERLGFGVEVDGDDLEVEVPPDRHYDVTREVDLIEEVGRVHGLDEHLPTTLPGASERRSGGLTREQRLRRRAEDDDARPRLRRDRRLELHRPRRGRAAADPRRATRAPTRSRLANPLSEDQSVDAHDAARLAARRRRSQPRPRRDRVALFESGRVYLPLRRRPRRRARWRATSRASARRRSPSRTGSAASPSGPLVAKSWRGGEEPADFFALKGVLEALGRRSSASSCRSRLRPSRSCTRAGRPRVVDRRRRRRLDRRGPPAGLPARGTSRRAVAFEVELAALVAAATAGDGDLRGRDHLPRRPPGPGRRRSRRGLRRRGARRRPRGRRRAAALGRGLRPLRGRAGRRGTQEPGAAARVPRRRPHPHRRGGRRRCASSIEAKLEEIGGALRE